MTFEKAIEVILRHEGGYINDPDDPGGETRFGISKRSYPKVDIKNLTRDQAIEIYRRDFWDKNKMNSFPAFVRLQVFDMAVNAGASAAIKIMQRALNEWGKEIKVDGVAGPETMGAVNNMSPLFSYAYALKRIEYYNSLKNKKFLSGWISRALQTAAIR